MKVSKWANEAWAKEYRQTGFVIIALALCVAATGIAWALTKWVLLDGFFWLFIILLSFLLGVLNTLEYCDRSLRNITKE